MMPGVTYLPVASMTRAFGSRAFTFGPTSAILPSRIRIDPLLIVPCEAVIMVAFLIRVSPGAVAVTPELAPAASFALPPACANAEATIASVSSDDRIALVFFIIPPQPIAACGLEFSDLRFQIPDSRLQSPDCKFQIANFELRIGISDSRFPDCRFQIADSKFWI